MRLLFLWDPVLLFLGNVLNVVTDRKLPVDIPLIAGNPQGDGIVDYFTGDVVSYSDYLAFGQIMPNRHGYTGAKYRFGFENQEMDDELKGEYNSLNFEYRMDDPRLGRFFAVDPLSKNYAYLSPYHFSHNSPIFTTEIEGLEGKVNVYKAWYDNDGYHVEHLKSYTVDGLKSDLNKVAMKPFGDPNGKTVNIKYIDAAGGFVTFSPTEKVNAKILNKFFGDQLNKEEKSTSSAGPTDFTNYEGDACEGGFDGANNGQRSAQDNAVGFGACSILTLPFTGMTTVPAIITAINGTDDMCSKPTENGAESGLVSATPEGYKKFVVGAKTVATFYTMRCSIKDVPNAAIKGVGGPNSASATIDAYSLISTFKDSGTKNSSVSVPANLKQSRDKDNTNVSLPKVY